MRVQSIDNTNNTNFGMAVTSSAKGKKMLEKYLTPKAMKELKQIVETEKTNPVNVHITTRPSLISSPYAQIPYDEFVVKVEDKTYTKGFMDMFSTSRAMMSAIKKGVKYAHELSDKRNILDTIPEKV